MKNNLEIALNTSIHICNSCGHEMKYIKHRYTLIKGKIIINMPQVTCYNCNHQSNSSIIDYLVGEKVLRLPRKIKRVKFEDLLA